MSAIYKSKALWIAGAVIVALGLYKGIQIYRAMHANHGMPPSAITVAVAVTQNWADEAKAVASLAPVQGATLSAEEAGKVTRINFESGSLVNAGDVLVQLDTSVEEANLKAAEAKAQLARVNLMRARTLRPQNANSQSDLDSAEATFKQSDAEANSLRAMIARKTIIAPFAGRAGIRMVNVGDFVAQGKPVVPVQSLDKIYANFALPQQRMNAVAVGQRVMLTGDAVAGEQFPGTITAIDPQVDEATRNFKIQATLDNASGKLRPGMFGIVTVSLGTAKSQIVIPISAVNYAPYGDSVYVIKDLKDPMSGKTYLGAEQHIVKLGEARGDMVAVLSGLQEGEKVASSGAFKLRPGLPVLVTDSAKPGESLAPKPEDT